MSNTDDDAFMALLAAIQAEDNGSKGEVMQSLFEQTEKRGSYTSLIILADHETERRRKRKKITRWPFPMEAAASSALLSAASKALLAEGRWASHPVPLHTFLDGDGQSSEEADDDGDEHSKPDTDDGNDESSEEMNDSNGRGSEETFYSDEHSQTEEDDDEEGSQTDSESAGDDDEMLPPCPKVFLEHSPLLFQVLHEQFGAEADPDRIRAQCERTLRQLSTVISDVALLAGELDPQRPLDWRGFLSVAGLSIDPVILERCRERLFTVFPSK